jgi:EAL domain-containing protein (putative c-di-GMP-specific phosphodiesterase class I)
VNALVGLGRGLGLAVAAEGADELGQETSLIDGGCDIGQGAMFSGAMDVGQALALVSKPLDVRPARARQRRL